MVGLLAAQQALGPPTESIVHLLDAEASHWFDEVCVAGDGGRFEWATFLWWSVSTVAEISPVLAASIARHYPRPDGFTYRVVVRGSRWGELAGGQDYELWKWDGTTAELVNVIQVDSY